MQILIPVIILGVMGLVFGALLGVAAKALKVEKDERIEEILELLPGANCGGCGYAGCSALAEAVAKGEAEPSKCPGAKKENIDKIADILGIAIEEKEKMIAKVLCSGTCDKAAVKYEYEGITDCVAAQRFGGGEKSCSFGCTGYGSCVSVCRFDAIHIENGVAVVDDKKCVGCGMCAAICPKNVIEMTSAKQKVFVLCKSKDKGAVVKDICSAGCIGCKLCEKNCPNGAICINDNLAEIDYSKCLNCRICAEKCPKKVISVC